jgi:hypothetical protein
MIVGIGHVDGAMTIGHGMRGIADVTVGSVRGICLGRIESEFTILAEIEVSGLRFVRRPGIKVNPVIAPRLEEQRFL